MERHQKHAATTNPPSSEAAEHRESETRPQEHEEVELKHDQ